MGAPATQSAGAAAAGDRPGSDAIATRPQAATMPTARHTAAGPMVLRRHCCISDLAPMSARIGTQLESTLVALYYYSLRQPQGVGGEPP